MKVEIELEIPNGYEVTGLFCPKAGDIFFSHYSNSIEIADRDFGVDKYFILKKVKKEIPLPDEWFVSDGSSERTYVSKKFVLGLAKYIRAIVRDEK